MARIRILLFALEVVVLISLFLSGWNPCATPPAIKYKAPQGRIKPRHPPIPGLRLYVDTTPSHTA